MINEMTAEELANDLNCASSEMEYGHTVSQWELLSDSAKMLLKQAEEIAELKFKVAFLEDKAIMVQPLDDSHYGFRAFLKQM